MSDWRSQLKSDPLPSLLASENQSIQFFAHHFLLEDDVSSVNELWNMGEVKGAVSRQLESGAWKYQSGARGWLRSSEDYNQLETYRILGVLVEKYGMNDESPAIAKAAEFLISHQTNEGDLRGIYGNQYSPNYTAAIMELLIKAGYEADSRIDKAFRWLLSIRQNDGGWAIPVRTIHMN